MSQPSPDARAVVAAVDRLTTQLSAEIRRLADTRPTPGDAPATTADDGPTRVPPAVYDEALRQARRRDATDDEEQQRTERREQLRTLLARLDRGGLLSPGDCTRLRQHIAAEQHEADTLRAITADHRVETRALREKLERHGQAAKEARERAEQAEAERDRYARSEMEEQARAEQAQAAIERVRAYAAETARSMKDATNDHDIGRYDTAVCVLAALREDAERFDEAEDVESLRAKLDEATATLRRIRALHTRITVQTTGGPADACDSCENDGMSYPWPCPTVEALAGPHPDGTEQPATKEPS